VHRVENGLEVATVGQHLSEDLSDASGARSPGDSLLDHVPDEHRGPAVSQADDIEPSTVGAPSAVALDVVGVDVLARQYREIG